MSQQASATPRVQRELAWRDRLARFAASGQSVESFCRNEAVSAWSFYRWRKLLGAADGQVTSPAAKSPAPFIDLGSMHAPQVRNARRAEGARDDVTTGIEIRIELGGGMVLQIARH